MKDISPHAQNHEIIPGSCSPMDKVKVTASGSNYVPIILARKNTLAIFSKLTDLVNSLLLSAGQITFPELQRLKIWLAPNAAVDTPGPQNRVGMENEEWPYEFCHPDWQQSSAGEP
jgi:hypothetical protein